MKSIIKQLLIWKYGIRGGIKPPLGYFFIEDVSTIKILLFAWRRSCHEFDSVLYRWCGIPDMWRDGI